MPRKVIVDCDPGHDDAIALLLAHGSPEIDLLAITTVMGNSTIENVTRNALVVATIAGIDAPVAAGCGRPLVAEHEAAHDIHGTSGLDGPVLPEPTRTVDPRHAVDVIIETVLREEPGTVTLVPTAALTNVAIAVRKEPRIVERVAEVVLMGGAVAGGNWSAAAEFNIVTDPEAAHIVFEAGWPVTMVGLDLTHQALATPEVVARIAALGTRPARFVVEVLEFFGTAYRAEQGFPSPPVHDPCAVARVIDPTVVTALAAPIAIELTGTHTRGMTVVDRRAPAPPGCRTQVAVDLDHARFWDLVVDALERIGGPGMTPRERAATFCARYGLTVPVLAAPMAGACPPALAVAVAAAGGMGAAGMVNDPPERIAAWMREFRARSSGPVQLNLWIPDPPVDDPARVEAAASYLDAMGARAAATGPVPDFAAQCEALLDAAPTAVSSIMGRFHAEFVRRLHDAGIAWFACATTLDDALAAQDAGADAVVAQGMEAGGHRGTIDPAAAETTTVGLFALVPRLADHLDVPVIAAGGIADGRGAAAALALGASAVQVGTALLRSPEAAIDPDWSKALVDLAPEDTVMTRAYTGRLARAVATPYVRAWQEPDAPAPAPYPQQRALVAARRRGEPGAIDPVNVWAGQAAALARDAPAGEIVAALWRDAEALLA